MTSEAAAFSGRALSSRCPGRRQGDGVGGKLRGIDRNGLFFFIIFLVAVFKVWSLVCVAAALVKGAQHCHDICAAVNSELLTRLENVFNRSLLLAQFSVVDCI